MNIYIGSYWVPHPVSKAGGHWTVIAKDKAECAEILKKSDPSRKGYWHKIDLAVTDARCFKLDDSYDNQESKLVEKFFT